MENDVVQRLKTAIKKDGRADRDISLSAGMSSDAVRGVFRNKSPTVETVRKLASALDVPPEWLAFGVGQTSTHEGAEGYVPIRGEVAAGLWMEPTENSWHDEVEVAPIAFTPEWPREGQYGLRVRGTSINRRAGDGDILRCIDIAVTGIEVREGDLVIVQRERPDGLREVTAELFFQEGATVRLEPDSTDEKHKPRVIDGNHFERVLPKRSPQA